MTFVNSRRLLGAILLLISSLLVTAGAGMLPMAWEGELQGRAGHHAQGRVVLSDGPYGALLAFKGYSVDRVPDGRVFLARNGDIRQGVEIAKLDQFSGEISLKVPAEVDIALFDSVVIWCEKFQVEIARATLE